MTYLAKLDNNVVVEVIVGNNSFSDKGIEWATSTFGGEWIETSYMGSFRKRFAGIGYTYNLELDAFIPPKPFDSWILNEETCDWEAPIPRPLKDAPFMWNEETVSWEELQ
jgi:hypothetical protein